MNSGDGDRHDCNAVRSASWKLMAPALMPTRIKQGFYFALNGMMREQITLSDEAITKK